MFQEQIVASRNVEIEEGDKKLKYLGFVKVITLDLYEQLKKHSGPLKSTVEALETAVDPFYRKFKGIPDKLLLSVDNKVDAVANVVDGLDPIWVGKFVGYVRSLIGKSLEIAETLIKVTKSRGPKAAIACACTLFVEIVITQLNSILYFAMRSKSFRSLVELAIPVAADCGRMFNNLVQFMKANGFPFISHLSLIQVEELVLADKAMEKTVILAEIGADAISDITGAGDVNIPVEEMLLALRAMGKAVILAEMVANAISGITGAEMSIFRWRKCYWL